MRRSFGVIFTTTTTTICSGTKLSLFYTLSLSVVNVADAVAQKILLDFLPELFINDPFARPASLVPVSVNPLASFLFLHHTNSKSGTSYLQNVGDCAYARNKTKADPSIEPSKL